MHFASDLPCLLADSSQEEDETQQQPAPGEPRGLGAGFQGSPTSLSPQLHLTALSEVGFVFGF